MCSCTCNVAAAQLWSQRSSQRERHGQLAGVLHVQCTFREAEVKHARFLKKLPGICAWREALLAAARRQCCVTTLGGRRRYFRNLAAADSGGLLFR